MAAMRSTALSGLRICDFTGQLAGAGATKILAAFGAEVIRIEDPVRQGRWDVMRGAPPFKDERRGIELGGLFNNHNVEKRGVTLNLRDERGRDLVRRLIAVSDVVTENFAAGVLERYGLDWESLGALRPGIIYVSNCGFGHTGPYRPFKTWGPVVQAIAGLTFGSGLPGHEPAGYGCSYMDHTGGYYMAMAILMAVLHRNRTGEGQWVDMAATEAGATLNGPALLDATVNGRPLRRPGMPHSNRSAHPRRAPHGIYPASGDDCWIAIACRDDGEWRALARRIDADWARDPALARLDGRIERQDELDERLGAWTATRDRFELEQQLCDDGVPAAAVRRPEERIDDDPRTSSWGLFPEVEHPDIGKLRVDGLPLHLSRTDWSMERGAPRLGGDNAYVLGELLGVSADELETLRKEGVI